MPEALAIAIIEMLNDRKGFDSWWDDLDDGIQSEILQEMTEVIVQQRNLHG